MVQGVTANRPGVVAAIAGGVTSLGLLLTASQKAPAILLILFVGWVGLPFVALFFLNLYVPRWNTPTKTALTVLTFVITVLSVLIYGYFTFWPLSSTPARTWLIVPAVSCALIVALPVFTLLRRKIKRE